MGWDWDGSRLYRFRISPADLAQGRWDRVSLTFESG